MGDIENREVAPEPPRFETQTLGNLEAVGLESLTTHPTVDGAGSRAVLAEVGMDLRDEGLQTPNTVAERVDWAVRRFDRHLDTPDFFVAEVLRHEASSVDVDTFKRAFKDDPRVLSWHASVLPVVDPEVRKQCVELMADVTAVLAKIRIDFKGVFKHRHFKGRINALRRGRGINDNNNKERLASSLLRAHSGIEAVGTSSEKLDQQYRFKSVESATPARPPYMNPAKANRTAPAVTPEKELSPFERLLAEREGDAEFVAFAGQAKEVIDKFIKEVIDDAQMSISRAFMESRVKAKLPENADFDTVFLALVGEDEFIRFKDVPEIRLSKGVEVTVAGSQAPGLLKQPRPAKGK
jgi:hypothetical protein